MSNYQERIAKFAEIASKLKVDENGFITLGQIEFRTTGAWEESCTSTFKSLYNFIVESGKEYRLKPEPTWRAFKGGHEFWPYVDKWVMAKDGGAPMRILEVTDTWVMLGDLADALDYQELFADYEFCIGNPFAENPSTEPCGVKE